MNYTLQHEPIMVALPSEGQVHLHRIYRNKKNLGMPVFMLHSMLHDGSVFYPARDSGLACYLARRGYDVYVADLRGKGKSRPQVNAFSSFGHHQAINEDIPALVNTIVGKRGKLPQVWIGHGWGSVLLCSYYARHGDSLCRVAKMVHFGARRQVLRSNLAKKIHIDILWRRLSRLVVAVIGYLPAKWLCMGGVNESRDSYRDYIEWSGSGDWRSTVDGYDYGEAVGQQSLPPSFYFAASGDRVYGDPDDVRGFIRELGSHDGRMMVLSRRGGNLREYNHKGMLCHQDCERDHFPILLDWLQGSSQYPAG